MNLQQLGKKLERGFYVDNLYEMAQLCRDLALDATNPTPFFVMEHIFLGIAKDWEDRPLTVEEAKFVESGMIKSLEELIEGIEKSALPEEVFKLLNRAISAYLASPKGKYAR